MKISSSKFATVAVLATALAATPLAPANAAGWHHGGGWGHHGGWGWGGVAAGVGAGLVGGAIVAGSCMHRQVVATPYGPAVRWVNYCY